jgi:lysophospholipase L1-like esterase
MTKKLILLVVILGYAATISAQEKEKKPRFWNDVQTIRKYDNMYAPPENPILFVGSSSIRKWNDLERTFAPYVVMNRGIGGAVVNDITFYLDDIVFPYHPREIVLYVGENDVVEKDVTADSIFNRTKVLYNAIRAKLPEIPIVYISMKPSPSRDKFRPIVVQANALISKWLASEQHVTFVDVYTPMLDKNGNSRPELFQQDMLHMTSKGYDIWRAAVEPTLIK